MNAAAGSQAVFPHEEYHQRLSRLRAEMHARDVAAVIIDECEMMHYVTGFAISENLYRAVLIPLDGDPLMVVRSLDEAPFLAASWFTRRRAFLDTVKPGRSSPVATS